MAAAAGSAQCAPRAAGAGARRRATRRARARAAVAGPAPHHMAMASAAAPRVAYQGMPGAYSERAAQLAYPDCVPTPCDQFEGAFASVEQWTADRAVLPLGEGAAVLAVPFARQDALRLAVPELDSTGSFPTRMLVR